MRNRPSDGGQPPGPAGPGRWQQRAGFSVFFDVQPTGPGALRRRTRLYHEETGDEITFPGSDPADWVSWMLDRLGSARPASEPAGATASVVSMEIIDVRSVVNPVSGPGDDSGAGELQLRVTGMAELHRMLGAKVVGILFGPELR